MNGLVLLATRQVRHHPVRSIALAVGVALTLFLPFSVAGLVDRYGETLRARAGATPLILGAPGSRYDLVLESLYFRGRTEFGVTIADADELSESGLAVGIPVFAGLTAGGRPLVGVDHAYYGFRSLRPERGSLPLRMGECVLGARAARELGLEPGGFLLSDRESLFDLAGSYPLRMRVAGVLEETGGPDDGAVFASVRTAWIAAGLGHGHVDAEEVEDEGVLARSEDGGVVLNASVVEFNEVTPENEADFHFHGEPGELPLTAVIVVPEDDRSRTLLSGRYRVREDLQLSSPSEVMEELLQLVLRVKVFFDAYAALVLFAAGLFLAVVVTLSLAARAGERRTLARIGCPPGTVARLFALELGIVVVAGILLAGISTLLLLFVLPATPL